MSVQNYFDSLSDDIKAKLKECKTEEEMKKVFADANIEMDADVLEAVNGGIDLSDLIGKTECPNKRICVSYEESGCPNNRICIKTM